MSNIPGDNMVDGVKNRGRVAPSHMAHVVIRTTRVAEVAAWYISVFEAEIAYADDNLAFLYFDREHHRIAIGQVPGLEQANHKAAGIDHVAFSYASIGDLLHTYQRLRAGGVLPYLEIDHGPSTSFYYRDPDGNQIELQVDNFDTREGALSYFRSEAFANNPLGVEIDAGVLLERWRKGDPPHTLLSWGTRSRNPTATELG